MALFVIKWSLSPLVIGFGALYCWRAYTRRGAGAEFRVRDLFRHRPMNDKSSAQLLIEGLFGILLGIIVLVWV
jgi:hypothetical protein